MGAEITIAYKKLGAWLARANNTVYQAATDGLVITRSISNGNLCGYTDNDNPPITIRGEAVCECVEATRDSILLPVRKNDYWKVEDADIIFWIPLEP